MKKNICNDKAFQAEGLTLRLAWARLSTIALATVEHIVRPQVILFFILFSCPYGFAMQDKKDKFDLTEKLDFMTTPYKQAAEAGKIRGIEIDNNVQDLREQRVALARKLDRKKIGQAEYDIQLKNIDEKIARFEKEHDKMVERGDKLGSGIQDVFVHGAKAVMKIQEDENLRKTKIATAAAQAAAQQEVKNKGDLERLKIKVQEFQNLMSDPAFYTKMGLFLSLTTVGMAGGYYGLKCAYHYAESVLYEPTLEIDVIKKGFFAAWRDVLFGVSGDDKALDDAIFSDELKEKIEKFATRTSSIYAMKKRGEVKDVPYQNLLLYGPPGTGKTMVARAIACKCGLTCLSIAPFQSIEQVHKTFKPVVRQKGLVILFFDEIDSFGSKRELLDSDRQDTKILDAFLAWTELVKHKCIIIGATNHKHKLSAALLSRFHGDQQHLVPLPDDNVLPKMVKNYWNKDIENDKNIKVADEITQADVDAMAAKLCGRGLSGRSIAHLFVALRTIALVDGQGILNKKLFDDFVAHKIEPRHSTAAS